MKTKIILLTVFSLSLFACKKEKDDPTPAPTPTLQILFGYTPSFSGLTPWSNQTEISFDSIKAHDYVGISITEGNLASLNGFTSDSGVIEFSAKTNNDEELFSSKNVNVKSQFSADIFGYREFGGEYFVPYKFTNTAVKGNDTLEISTSMDMLKIIYKSKYTSQSGGDSIRLIP